MSEATTLDSFQELFTPFKQHQQFLEKIDAVEDQFSAAAVSQVRNAHLEARDALVSDLVLVVFQIEEEQATLTAEVEALNSGNGEDAIKLEELEMRLMIGEIGEAEYMQLGQESRDAVKQVEAKVKDLQAQGESLSQAIAQWEEVASKAGVLNA